jgi:hypothetical protein
MPAGQLVTAGQLKSLLNAASFLLNPPRCQAYQTTGQTVASATNTPLSFQSEVYDTDGMHSTTTNPWRLTVQTAGLYNVQAYAIFTTTMAATVQVQAEIWINGSPVEGGSASGTGAGSGIGTALNISAPVQLNVGDYVELVVFQNSGATITTYTGSQGFRSTLAAVWVASS